MRFYYTVDKMVTSFNETTKDWSGETQDFGIVIKGVVSAGNVARAIAKISSEIGVEFEDSNTDEVGRYWGSCVEANAGVKDENGKWLADYNVYIERLVAVKS